MFFALVAFGIDRYLLWSLLSFSVSFGLGLFLVSSFIFRGNGRGQGQGGIRRGRGLVCSQRQRRRADSSSSDSESSVEGQDVVGKTFIDEGEMCTVLRISYDSDDEPVAHYKWVASYEQGT